MIPYCIAVIEDDDDRAFMEQLYTNYNRLMYSEIIAILKNQWDTEDVMQSVLIKLIDKIADLRLKPRDRLINYIITACKNTSYNYIRDHSKKRDLSYDDYIEGFDMNYYTHEAELPIIRAEEMDSLFRIWPKLDERTRLLLEGYYILEKPMSKLGEELGIKPSSVRMTLVRARQKAFDLLQEELNGSGSRR